MKSFRSTDSRLVAVAILNCRSNSDKHLSILGLQNDAIRGAVDQEDQSS